MWYGSAVMTDECFCEADEGEGQDLFQRLATGLSSARLYSLDPDEVLRETAALLRQVLPLIQATVLPVERLSVSSIDRLTDDDAQLFEQARRRAQTVVVDDGRRAAVPLAVCGQARATSGERCSARPDLLGTGPSGTGDSAAHTAAAPAKRKRIVGVALLTSPSVRLDTTALLFAELLADRAAVALEHALLYETQVSIAQQLQRRLLPVEAPAIQGLETGLLFRSRTDSAEIGGDFLDFVSLSPKHMAVTVADVSGKGVEAAAVTVLTKYALRAIITTLRWPAWPGEVLRDLHNALQGQLDAGSFVTVLFAMIDVGRRSVTLSSAGHPAPFVIHEGRAQQPLLATAPAIALVDYSELDPLATERVELCVGDTLVLHTDGLAELRDAQGRFYEEQRMPAALAEFAHLPPSDLVAALYEDGCRYAARPPNDDIALVAVRLTE